MLIKKPGARIFSGWIFLILGFLFLLPGVAGLFMDPKPGQEKQWGMLIVLILLGLFFLFKGIVLKYSGKNMKRYHNLVNLSGLRQISQIAKAMNRDDLGPVRSDIKGLVADDFFPGLVFYEEVDCLVSHDEIPRESVSDITNAAMLDNINADELGLIYPCDFECPSCGAHNHLKMGRAVVVCEYCGTQTRLKPVSGED